MFFHKCYSLLLIIVFSILTSISIFAQNIYSSQRVTTTQIYTNLDDISNLSFPQNRAPCDSKGGDSDGDGICDEDDCEPYDASIPAAPGTPCDDGDMETVYDVILEDSCSCIGEFEESEIITYLPECARRTAFNTNPCVDSTFAPTPFGGKLLLKGQAHYYYLRNGQLIEYTNGTAIFIGEWINVANNDIKFDVNMTLSGRTVAPPTATIIDHHCLVPNESTFYYYTQITGTLTGKDKVKGARLTMEQSKAAFQLGIGANAANEELSFGGASWLKIELVQQPTATIIALETNANGSNGAINMNLSGNAFTCIENPTSARTDCQTDMVVTAEPNQMGKVVTWNPPTFTSNCITPTATTPMIQQKGPSSGDFLPIGTTTVVYESKDICGNITNCSFKVTVKPPTSPCSNGNKPKVRVAVDHPICDQKNGKINLTFGDRSNRNSIEFSLDGGQTFPLNVNDNAGTAVFDSLKAESYHLFARWGTEECPVDLGIQNLEGQTLTPGTFCDDGNTDTENDVIQSDSCLCEGTVFNSSGCDDLFKNISFENQGITPWKFNSNTRYNRSNKYQADGDWTIWIYKKHSNRKDAAIYQDAAVIPRAHYKFSFFAGTHKTYYNHEVAVEFYNKYGAKLKRKVVQIDFDIDETNSLKEYFLEETAPVDATKIRLIGTTSGDYLKLDAICVQIDKLDVRAGRKNAPLTQGAGLLAKTLTLNSYVKNEGVVLDWFSNIPEKTSSFVVEKSVDGGPFEFFNEMSDLEDGVLSITDAAPDYGTNSYRVIQKLKTGEALISNIRAEQFMLDPASITLYPNPAIDDLNLRIGHFATIEGTVRIFSPNGLEVYTQTISAEEKHLNIDISTFKNGIYFLLIEAKNRKSIERQFIVESLK